MVEPVAPVETQAAFVEPAEVVKPEVDTQKELPAAPVIEVSAEPVADARIPESSTFTTMATKSDVASTGT